MNTSNKEPSQESGNNYFHQLTTEASNIDVSKAEELKPGILSEAQAKETIKRYSEDYKVTEAETLLIFTYLFQKGATVSSCNPEEHVVLNGKKHSVKMLKTVLTKQKLQKKARQLARFLAPCILQLSKEKNIPGNLARTIARKHEISQEDLPYYSDFFTEDNIGKDKYALIAEHLASKRRKPKS